MVRSESGCLRSRIFFFAIDNTTNDLKVRLSSIHFDGAASTWHQAIIQSESGSDLLSDWIQYCR